MTQPAVPPVPDRARILLVEDSEDDALLLAHGLKQALGEAHLQRVDTPGAMREALARDDWDLVISDHCMPHFDAGCAQEMLRDTGKEIPFVIYSGHIDAEQALSAMDRGAHDWVEKGNLRRLLAVVRRELRGAAARRARVHSRRRPTLDRNPSTRLSSRQRFAALAAELLARARESGGATLLFIDVDRFMRVNDTFGYAVGDRLLVEVAARLRQAVSPGGIVTRAGRDDFAVVDPAAATHEQARALVLRVTEAFARPFQVEASELFLTLSIGVCCSPVLEEDFDRLLVNAENAMFLAKRAGRNNVQFHARDASGAAAERLSMETALRHAVARGELMLHYQPSVSLPSARIHAVEALLRWTHPTLGMVPPDRFIPLADETGLIAEIGRFVLLEACRQTRRWHDQGLTALKVSVNVSAVQFRRGDLAQVVADVLEQTGLAPSYLQLEITETVLMREADATIETLRSLKAMGVCISVDDFGTGYSSLAYLKRFPIDTLKIDKCFMRDVASGGHDAAIVRTVIALAKSLALESIAEGVETREQLEFLLAEGCDRIQGFYFSRPLPAPALYEFIARQPVAGMP